MSTIPIPAAEPIALQPGEGERRWFHGFLITIKSSAETTNGRVAVVEHLGWVEEWDDDGELFLITFAASQPTPRASVEEEDDLPFQLEREASSGRKTTAPTRPGQHRFSYRVLRRYGSRCAVCDVSNKALLDAAQLRAYRDKRSDVPATGSSCAPHTTEPSTSVYSRSNRPPTISLTATAQARLV